MIERKFYSHEIVNASHLTNYPFTKTPHIWSAPMLLVVGDILRMFSNAFF